MNLFYKFSPLTRFSLVVAVMVFSLSASAQLNCKVVKAGNGSTTKTCFHKNGKASVVEVWDAINREGAITCFNAAGKQIFYESLRRFAGHASVYLDYYQNGQIKKAEYSSAPDGGIQFWHTIYRFDENGNQTDVTDMSQPDGHPVLHIDIDTSRYAKYKTVLPEKRNPAAECAVPFITVCELVNETNRTIKIWMKARPNLYVQIKDTIVTVKPGQTVLIKPIVLAQMFLKFTETYEPVMIRPLKGKSTYKIIAAHPDEQKQQKKYTWYVVKLIR